MPTLSQYNRLFIKTFFLPFPPQNPPLPRENSPFRKLLFNPPLSFTKYRTNMRVGMDCIEITISSRTVPATSVAEKVRFPCQARWVPATSVAEKVWPGGFSATEVAGTGAGRIFTA
jgi:hypothetical protein